MDNQQQRPMFDDFSDQKPWKQTSLRADCSAQQSSTVNRNTIQTILVGVRQLIRFVVLLEWQAENFERLHNNNKKIISINVILNYQWLLTFKLTEPGHWDGLTKLRRKGERGEWCITKLRKCWSTHKMSESFHSFDRIYIHAEVGTVVCGLCDFNRTSLS